MNSVALAVVENARLEIRRNCGGEYFRAFFLSTEGFEMAGEEEKREGKGFTVQDRRRFSETGDARDSAPETVAAADHDKQEARFSPEESGQAANQPLPEINFSTFVISLSTQALMHLGEIPNPLSGKEEIDVPVAKQMIDIVGMLQEKTRGNLDSGEAKLIEDILFDLRMKYVEAVKRK